MNLVKTVTHPTTLPGSCLILQTNDRIQINPENHLNWKRTEDRSAAMKKPMNNPSYQRHLSPKWRNEIKKPAFLGSVICLLTIFTVHSQHKTFFLVRNSQLHDMLWPFKTIYRCMLYIKNVQKNIWTAGYNFITIIILMCFSRSISIVL